MRLSISALNRKLLRDLWKMKTQALAIALVVAAGVAMYVMYLSNFASLRQTQENYYQRQRFADVFASLKRAPQRIADDIAAIPGVAAFETRTVTTVTLDLVDLEEPASARIVSIPSSRRPSVNDLFVRRGRWIEAGRPDEVLASEGFVDAHGLQPGDTLPAVINGRRRVLTIVGVALSPEYIYSIRPGELVPDDKRFAVLWMEQRAVASAMDMDGAFNDVVLTMSSGRTVNDAIARLDRILEPYGGLGAIPRALQPSHWTVENELAQLQSFGFLLPLIFLMVAAFILNVALTRALALQRAQIAALKALGYGNLALGWHYMKWALAIGAAGVVVGLAAGAWLGAAIGDLYNEFFRFPVLLFSVPPSVIGGATVLTLVAAAAGAFSAVRRAVRVPPAEAMRPEAPARYRRTVIETSLVTRRIGTAGRMVLRNLARRPGRGAISVFGIGFAVAVLMIGFVFVDAIDRLITMQFSVTERQDVTVNFVEPRGGDSRHTLARLPGVVAVEPQRVVAARVRAGHRERYLAITGVDERARLRRIVDRDGRLVRLAPSGVVLSQALADVLSVRAGDSISLEVLEGSRPQRTAVVTGVVNDVMGLSVYMEMGALHRMMREGDVYSGAVMLVDSARHSQLSRALKTAPLVAGVGFKHSVLRSFRETMAANMNMTMLINLLFAGVIAFGVVYNSARVSLSERSHELASMRVLGFTRAEISFILMGELAVLTLLALPVGALFGYALSAAIATTVQSEVYRVPLYVSRQAVASSFLGIIAAALVSALLVRRRLDDLDLIAVLKVRE